jgi:hypothetical protein
MNTHRWKNTLPRGRVSIDIKRKTYIIRISKNIYLSTYHPLTLIHLSRRFTSMMQPAEQNSFEYHLSHFRNPVSTSSSSAKRFPPSCEPCFTRPTFPTVKRKHLFMNILCIESFCPQNTHNKTLLFGRTLLRHVRHVDYWNQALNMRILVCYLHSHKAELYCYLMIRVENLLRSLHLFYFHLWPIYWLSLVVTFNFSNLVSKITNCSLEPIIYPWTARCDPLQ